MLWVKVFHIYFMVSWFACLFYLPRLFVYHSQCEDEPGRERFKVMERKLFVMMTIAAAGTIIFGVWMLIGYGWQAYYNKAWLHMKLLLVAVLIVYNGYCWKLMQEFKEDRNRHSDKFYRWINEFPTLILLPVLILVVVKPF